MLHLTLLLMLWPQIVAPQVPPQTAPATQPAVEGPRYDEGPLRAVLMAMREVRLKALEPVPAGAMESDLQMRVRIQGERITQVSRYTNMVLTEAVDDTGQSLIDENTFPESQRDTLLPLRIPAQRMATTGLMLNIRIKPAARGAKTIKVLRGSSRLILADKSDKITIDNPMQYYGKSIPDSALDKLGLVVEVVPYDQLKEAPPGPQCVVLRFKAKPEHVRDVSFFDGTMRPLYFREIRSETLAGDACAAYAFENATGFNDEMQLVLEVHPTVDSVTIPIEAENIELP